MNGQKFANFKFITPPLNEQRQIAAFLDKHTALVDQLISKKEQQIELLKEKRQALITRAVTKGLDDKVKLKPSGIDWIGDIPEGWEVRRSLGLFDERIEKGYVELELLVVSQAYGIIPQKSYNRLVNKKDISNENKESYKLVERDDIAYNKMRMWQGAVGISNFKGIVSPAYVVLKNKEGVYPKYYFYLFKSKGFVTEAGKYSYGICDDMNSLRYEDFKCIYLPYPLTYTQRQIAAFLDKETSSIDLLEQKIKRSIDLLKEYRSSLITNAVLGRIDINNDRY